MFYHNEKIEPYLNKIKNCCAGNKNWYNQIISDMDLNEDEIEAIIPYKNYLKIVKHKQIYSSDNYNNIIGPFEVEEIIELKLNNKNFQYKRNISLLKSNDIQKGIDESCEFSITTNENDGETIFNSYHFNSTIYKNPQGKEQLVINKSQITTDTYLFDLIQKRENKISYDYIKPISKSNSHESHTIISTLLPTKDNVIVQTLQQIDEKYNHRYKNEKTTNKVYNNEDITGKDIVLSSNCLEKEHAKTYILQNLI